MQRKIFLFSVLIMFLIVITIPITTAQDEAEKSWWDSLINYFMELFGISQEEAQTKAMEMISPYHKTVELGDNKYSTELYSNIEFVNEDNIWKTKEEARSLKGSGYECNVESDGINLIECVDYNWTSRTLKLKRDSLSLSNVPLRKYENVLNETTDMIERIYDSKVNTNLNFIDNKEVKEIIINVDINDVIEFGEHSSTTNIFSNATSPYVIDTFLSQGAAATNYGTSIYMYVNNEANDKVSLVYYNTALALGTNINLLGVSWSYSKQDIVLDGSFNCRQLNTAWGETGATWNTNGSDNWAGGLTYEGSLIQLLPEGSGSQTINMTNLTAMQETHNNFGGINMRCLGTSNCDYNLRTREDTSVPLRHYMTIIWEVGNEVPTNPILILNSTNLYQQNYTNETLACNFECLDTDAADTLTYDIDWIKNGEAQFGFSSEVCVNPSYNSPELTNGNMSGGDLWSCSVNITDNNGASSLTVYSENLTARTYIENQPPFNLQIVSPSPDNNTVTTNNTFEFNCTAEDTTPDNNIIYYEYYLDGNNPPTTLIANTTDSTINETYDGEWLWRCRATDNYSESSSYSDVRYLYTDNATIKSTNYYSPIDNYESLKGNYNFTVILGNLSVSDISTVFTFNNQDYTLTKTLVSETAYNTTYLFSYNNLPAPLNTESVNILWNSTLTLRNGTFNYEENALTLTIGSMLFGTCNATLTDDFINLTFKDEETNELINASITSSTFVYSLGADFELNKSYSFTNTTENDGYDLCFDPVNQTLFLDMDIGYESTGYPQRNLVKNSSYTNTMTTEVLYLLKTASGIYSTFQVINPASQTLIDVYVLVERSISGSYVFVEQGYTDSAGAVTFFLNPDYTYRFTFTKSGYTTSTLTIKPTQSTYTVTMGQVITETKSYYTGVTYDIGPTGSTVANETDITFTFNTSSGYYSLEETGFVLTNKTGSYLGSDSCTTATGCIASATINTDNHTYIIMNYYWIIDDSGDKYMNGSRSWYVLKAGTRKSSFTMATEDIAKLGSGFDDFTKAIIVIAIIMFVIGSLTYYTGVYSPMAIIAEIFFLVFFFDVGLNFIPNWWGVPHLTTILIGIMTFGYAVFEWNKGGTQ